MSIALTTQPFGVLADGQKAQLFTLTNKNGAVAKITDYGATLTELHVPDKNGKFANVALGFSDLAGYLRSKVCPGATIGRYANRIAKGSFELDGKEYTLAINNNGNTLHGGLKGFDKVMWQAEQASESDAQVLTLKYASKDMEEGFPGNLDVKVVYKLNNSNQLEIILEAKTDKKTIVNLTNHSYFNLKGEGVGDVLDHELIIDADSITAIDDVLIPTGVLQSVDNGPFDFRKKKSVGADIKAAGGYDHNWCLNKPVDAAARESVTLNEPAQLELSCASVGRRLRFHITQPGVQVFTSNGFTADVWGKDSYGSHSGIAIEPQHFPDSIHHANFPSVVLNPDETYWHRIVIDFNPPA